jgi:hypothetical protein
MSLPSQYFVYMCLCVVLFGQMSQPKPQTNDDRLMAKQQLRLYRKQIEFEISCTICFCENRINTQIYYSDRDHENFAEPKFKSIYRNKHKLNYSIDVCPFKSTVITGSFIMQIRGEGDTKKALVRTIEWAVR